MMGVVSLQQFLMVLIALQMVLGSVLPISYQSSI